MAIVYKCKCCAANLDVEEGMRLTKCPACKTKQTLPSSRDENIQNLFNRATTLRLKSEFDKAETVYERIIQADEEQYEAYWGLILCKYPKNKLPNLQFFLLQGLKNIRMGLKGGFKNINCEK